MKEEVGRGKGEGKGEGDDTISCIQAHRKQIL